MIVVAAHITLKEGLEAEFIKKAQGCIEQTRKEEGCISYALFSSTEDASKLVFLEEWESKAALDAHLQTPHLKAFSGETGALRDGPSDLCIYEAEKL